MAFPKGFRIVAVAMVAACAVLLVLSASASASVGAYNEPTYTKTSGNNTYWYNWTAVTGLNESGTNNYTYYLCLSTYHNGVQEEFSSGVNGPGTTNCTGSLRSGPTPSTGNSAFVPYNTGTVLQDGHRYEMCATGFRWYVYLWSYDNVACGSTIVDRNKPTLGVTLGNGANLTNNPAIPVSISYNDATSPPWAGSNGYASNWDCITAGSSCTPGGQPDNNCSAPNGGFGNRINSFNCALSIGTGDGQYAYCVFGADQAIPDNPSGTNQFASATSNNANLSNTVCDTIVLDRAGPSVTVTPSATNVTVGQLVTFTQSASDPNGLSGGVSWDFGDNTPQSSGATATHTYTQPGTYVVKASQNDAAGNRGEGTVTITVNPATSNPGGDTTGGGTTGGGTTGGGTTGGGTTGGDTTGGGTTGGGTVTPGTQTGTSGATPLTSGMTSSQVTDQVQQQAGGGGATNVSIGALDIVSPKRFTAGKRTLLLAFTTETGGTLGVAFLKGSKVVARKSAKFGGPGTYTVGVKVPKKLKAGTYKLKVTFRPTGASRATSKTLKVKVVAKRKTRRKAVAPPALRGTKASRSRQPQAVDPRKVNRTIVVR